MAAALSWRLLIIAAVVLAVGYGAAWLYPVTLPVMVALLLAALLAPFMSWLVDRGLPRVIATVLVLCGGLAAVGGVMAFVVGTVVTDLPRLQAQVAASAGSAQAWLQHGPLHVDQRQLDHVFGQAAATLHTNQSSIASGALSTAVTSGTIASGTLLVLFTLVFFLYDGRRIWNFLLRTTVPGRHHGRVERAGVQGFAALVGYVRATAAVACMDAVGVGVGTALVGVPLAPALGALVFLGAFVPYLGIVIAGSLAVVVALFTNGATAALIVAAIVLGVTQLEGHVLQPLMLGRAARLHPLAVVLAISAGFVLAGVAGAVVAVPMLAIGTAAARALADYEPEHDDPHPRQSTYAEQGGASSITSAN